MRKLRFLKCLMAVVLLCTIGSTSVFAEANEYSFDTEKYSVKKGDDLIGEKSIQKQKDFELSLFGDTSEMEIDMINHLTGEKNIGAVEEIQTQKLYDLVDKQTGEEAVQYKTEIQASSSDHQIQGNKSDSNNGMTFYETIYYTVHLDKAGFAYVNINKVDYRLEIKDSLYKVTQKKMEIQQNGMGISGKAVSNQTKILDIGTSGTILPRDYGWTPVNVPSLGARVATKTTAKIEVKGSTWDFTFTLNPR